MKRRFNHFVIFKVVVTTAYLVSGIIMFSLLAVNVNKTFKIVEVEISCENCDEID
jgi:hypothetical protein